MPERRGSRFVVEALFLAALTVALALAHLEVIEIVGAMALGWLVVAAIEWTAWRGEPHYGSGLPPRYYLPRVDLPPPQPLERVEQGYPDGGRDDAPTWIAPAALRAEVLGTWPVAGSAPRAEDGEESEVSFVPEDEASDPWTVIGLPPTPRRDAPTHPDSESARLPAPRPGTLISSYTLDPLGDQTLRRRRRRGGHTDDGAIRVPTKPEPRRLPHSLEY